MTDEQIKPRSARQTNRGVMRRKSDYFAEASGKKLLTHGAREKTIAEEYDSSDSELPVHLLTAPVPMMFDTLQ